MKDSQKSTKDATASDVEAIVSNHAVCSGCDEEKATVDRYMFDGLCADCTDRALYDYKFQKQAQKTNRVLIEHGY
ncbi:hypothetical protein [Gracilimonas sediminicola]|uniref:Uncharacterized protein n=1 Tax=Gracilimonas sediminicola TaxID=2952158 RepID=A0A9X2L0I6_9BACT|nr:hypothetical protein [Gracilimonas sediminicola]MCP9290014.1 hypothetical protein [Gracilimonas sediminicola]